MGLEVAPLRNPISWPEWEALARAIWLNVALCAGVCVVWLLLCFWVAIAVTDAGGEKSFNPGPRPAHYSLCELPLAPQRCCLMSLTRQQESINTQAPWLSPGECKATELKQEQAESEPSELLQPQQTSSCAPQPCCVPHPAPVLAICNISGGLFVKHAVRRKLKAPLYVNVNPGKCSAELWGKSSCDLPNQPEN